MCHNNEAFKPLPDDYLSLIPSLVYQDVKVAQHALTFLSQYLNCPYSKVKGLGELLNQLPVAPAHALPVLCTALCQVSMISIGTMFTLI